MAQSAGHGSAMKARIDPTQASTHALHIHSATLAPDLHGGEGMRRLVAEHDWASTPLGPRELWPASLKALLALTLDSTEPMVV